MYNIVSYEIYKEKLYVHQDVDMSGKDLLKFPFPIQSINGNLSITGNKLTSTKGFPKEITGSLDISYNLIEDFQGFPRLKGSLILDSNKFKSLKGIKSVEQILSVDNNKLLSTLSYAPKINNYKNFFCRFNNIPQDEITIYIECIKKKKWNPLLTVIQNGEKIEELKSLTTKLKASKFNL